MTTAGNAPRPPRSKPPLPLRWRYRWLVAQRTPPPYDRELAETIDAVRNYTMTAEPRLAALYDAVRYVVANRVEGAIVECGVWRGGSMMAAALTLNRLGAPDRDIWLFDAFEGAQSASPEDTASPYGGDSAPRRWLRRLPRASPPSPDEDVLDARAVRDAVESTSYPPERIHVIEGRVEDTLPDQAPDRVALLRLDTDLYGSTRHELVHLYPRLSPGGILIIDDYGHYPGVARAVDDFVASSEERLFLARIDYSGRIAVKPSSHANDAEEDY